MNESRAIDVPSALRRWLSTANSDAVIYSHQISIDRDWWTRQLAVHDFDDTLLGSKLSRSDLFQLADAAIESPEGAISLLWNTLAWGVGTRPRNVKRRIAAVAADRARAGELLQEAAQMSRIDPVRAYELLRPNKYRNAITWLGPAFFTKFLYFAGGGRPDHPCCILDNRVARTLQTSGWPGLANGSWSAQTYDGYTSLIGQWRRETDCARNDLIERWLFDAGGTGPNESAFSPDELRSIHYWLWLAARTYPTSGAPEDFSEIEPKISELLDGDVWGEDVDDETIEGKPVLRADALEATSWIETHREDLIAVLASASDQSDAASALVGRHGLSRALANLCLQAPIWLLTTTATAD